MAEIWYDAIDPLTLTYASRDYAREYQEKQRQDSHLSSYLPNFNADDAKVSLDVLNTERPTIALNRAWDAEPAQGETLQAGHLTFKLPPLTKKIALSEFQKYVARTGKPGTEAVQRKVLEVAFRAVRAVDDALEYQRGQVLTTGKTVLSFPGGHTIENDWGRDASMSVTAATQWSDPDLNIVEELRKYVELYEDKNSLTPQVLLVSRQIATAVANNKRLALQGLNGLYSAATLDQVNAHLGAYGLPTMRVYNRKIRNTTGQDVPVLDPKNIYLLPSENTYDLGATFMAPTEAALDLGWPLSDAAGIYVGAYKNSEVPVIASVTADALAAPALANPNMAFTAKVLN
jgi:hypothetical protein